MVLDDTVVQEFKNSSSIHGLSRFGGPELYSRRRLIWIVLVLSAGTGLITMVIIDIIHLSSNPTSTVFSSLIKNSIDFPAVTICNLNQVKNTITKCLQDDNENAIKEVFYALSELSLIIKHIGDRDMMKASIPGKQIHECALNNSHQLNDMLLYCHFKQELVPCDDIFVPKMTEYGQCYTFNADGQKQTASVGEAAGLRLFVNIQQDSYFFSPTIRAGIKVVLHDPREEPLPSLRGILVGPGLSASVDIKRTKVTTLPSPYGSCRETEDISTAQGTYSELTCYKACYDEYMMDKCGCRHFFSKGTVDFCDSKDLIKCYAGYLNNISRDTSFLHNCSCPPSCQTIKYETSVSYGAFSSEFISNFLFDHGLLPSPNYTDRNFIDLRLYYNTMIQEETTEIPQKNIGDIFGTLGGQMGMFLGASILSLVELIEFICLLMTRSGRKISDRRKSTLSADQPDLQKNTSEF